MKKTYCPIRKFNKKKETFTANHGFFPMDFLKNSVSTTCFTRSSYHGSQCEHINYFFKISYLLKNTSLSPHAVNKQYHIFVHPLVYEQISSMSPDRRCRSLSLLTGPKSYFQIKVSRKVGCVLTSNEVYFVSFADNFTV